MAEGKNAFILYADQKEIVCSMTNEQAGELFKTIMTYVNDENPTPREDIKFAFIAFKSRLKYDLKLWEEAKTDLSSKRSEAGKKGMLSRYNRPQQN